MKKFLSRSYIFIVFLFLYAPILLLIFFSFNSSNSNVVFEGFSLRWYEELFRDEGDTASFAEYAYNSVFSVCNIYGDRHCCRNRSCKF